MALGIGLGETVEVYTNVGVTQPLEGICGVMYLSTGMAVLAIFIVLMFVRVLKDRRDGYDDGEEKLEV
jgi:hypothetical protein